jgi:hypothetical protein
MILPYFCIENSIYLKEFENLKSPLDDMYSRKKKTEENKSRANTGSVARKKSSERQGFGFVDNRTCAETQKSLQLMMNNRYQLVEQKQPSQGISGSIIQNKKNIIANKAKDIAAEYGMMYGWSDAYEKQYAESEEARERAISRIERSLEPKPSYII